MTSPSSPETRPRSEALAGGSSTDGAEGAAQAAAKAKAAADRKRNARLVELDALRALMVLVISFHAYQASQGEDDLHVFRDLSVPGVLLGNIDVLLPIFFVLSGFAIYYQFAAFVLAGRPLPGSREWLIKRALRLLPVYYVTFAIVWVWRYGGGVQQWEDLAYGLTLMQTWSTDHIFRTIDPGWYLSIEWHFALIVALFVMPWMRAIGNWPQRSRLAGLLVPPAVLFAITIWWRTTLESHEVPGDRWGAWFAPPSWTMMYGAGMLLGLALVLRPPHLWRLPKPAPLLIFAGATAFLIELQLLRGDSRFATLWFFHLAIIGVMLWMVAAIAADPDGRVRRFLRSKPVQGVAAASFVTYVIHAPILRSLDARNILPMDNPNMWWASAASIVIISISLGYLVHRYVEGPLTSIEKLLVPKVARVSKVVRTTKPQVAIGQVVPDALLPDTGGELRPLRRLGDGRPVLLLVHPTGIIPRHPSMQGTGGALRALDATRAAAPGLGLALATLSPPSRGTGDLEGDGDAHLEPVVHLVDTDAAAAKALGVATVRTAGGLQVPELVLLVLDADGRVADVVREHDPQTLLHRGVLAAEQLPQPGGRFRRQASADGAVSEAPASRTPRPMRPNPGSA